MYTASCRAKLALVLLVALMAGGCGALSADEDPKVLAQRAKFMLDQEPAEVVSVLDVREARGDAGEVAVVGRIGGVKTPFTKNRASFVIVDPSVMAHGDHVCDSDDCPHCAKAKQQQQLAATAVVEFVDEEGQVLPINAQRLFALQAGQTVVVRGKARFNDLEHLIITADGLYVRE